MVFVYFPAFKVTKITRDILTMIEKTKHFHLLMNVIFETDVQMNTHLAFKSIYQRNKNN